ncbi:uncharacterized protein MELLADRAFT_112241 [Melampsora larici-populina 98AG31]|uniref:Uncharacterized protein n=1 Tax=Melampsora larici-populina (strain 98AG31 / pathotype 3-4-7) TaxID=747676 RepID=F4S5U3_MELLP|nr:uncharacterized protein MELLADRAFT_112241 [Melampsora larici-populina 98AG31]EGF99957.1 hypothetical protein MELLADRAFT_112241 [Melampsora larici-populina 98AG31]
MSSTLENHESRASITSETKSPKIAYNLSSMPHEVKETIVEWLYLSSQINQLLRRHWQYDIPHDSIGFSRLESDEESTSEIEFGLNSTAIDLKESGLHLKKSLKDIRYMSGTSGGEVRLRGNIDLTSYLRSYKLALA